MHYINFCYSGNTEIFTFPFSEKISDVSQGLSLKQNSKNCKNISISLMQTFTQHIEKLVQKQNYQRELQLRIDYKNTL